MGPFDPLIYLLEVFRKLLAEDTKFWYMQAADWRSVNWKLHLAIQGYFHPGPVDAKSRLLLMEDLLERLRKSKIIHNHEVPPEIQCSNTGTDGDRAARVTGGGRSGNLPRGDILGQGAVRSPGGASAGKKASAECAKILKKPLEEAEKAVTESGQQWSLDCIFQGDMAEAFGGMM